MSNDARNNTQAPRLNLSETSIPFWRQVRWNLVISFVLIAIIPLIIVVTLIVDRINTQLHDQVIRQLDSVAELKSDQITRWLENSRSTLSLLAANRATSDRISVLLQRASSIRDESQLEQNPVNDILSEAVEAQDQFEEFFLYEANGRIIASSNLAQIGKLVTAQPYFEASIMGEVIQSPYYELGQGQLTMILSQPVMSNENEQIIGVLAGRLSLNTLGEIMTDHTGLQESGETYLVSPENNYLVTPIRLANEAYSLRRAYRSIGIDQALAGTNGVGTYLNYQDPPVPVIGVYRWLPDLQVALLAEINEAEALSLFAQVRRFSALLATGAAVIAILVGFYTATLISRPINSLIQATIQFAGGDLSQRVNINQRNEISLLAVGFNQMAADIKELIDSLEQRVADRTQRLTMVAELGEKLSAILDLKQLLAEVVKQVEQKFDYYHTHIYLIDERRENLVVVEGTGTAGMEMKAKGHSIPLDASTSLVARTAQSGAPVRVDNVREAADWLPNALLPDTYAEMAVPIILEGEVVGVLDVQEDEIGGLDEGDESLLRSLANQVAVAIRNARLFEQIETALAEAQAAQERYLEQAWAKSKIAPASRQYLYARPEIPAADRADKQHLLTKIQQQAHTHNRPAIVNAIDDDPEGISMVAPITLRDKVIGAMQLHRSQTDRSWTDEDLTMIEVIAEQFAQSAENLRLFDQTRKKAVQEQTIRAITEKIRSAVNLEALVRTASQELGQHLSAGHSIVELGLDMEQPATEPLSETENGTQGEVTP